METSPPRTGSGATKIVLTVDHPTILTDLNDVPFIKAAISDAVHHRCRLLRRLGREAH
jgi:hypothetical protein